MSDLYFNLELSHEKKLLLCYEPQKLDKNLIKLLVSEFGIVPDSFHLE